MSALTNIVDGNGTRYIRYRVSDCPMCRDWPLNMAGGCACCEGQSTRVCLPDQISAVVFDAHARGIAEGLERAAQLIADDSEYLLVNAVKRIRDEAERQANPTPERG